FIGFKASLPMTAAFFLPEWAVHAIAIGGLLALFTSLNAMLLIFPHELYVMAKDRAVSTLFLMKLKRFNTPYVSLILVGFITITLIHLGFSGTAFATMTVAGFLLGSMLMGFSALNIFKKANAQYEAAAVRLPKRLLIGFTVLGIFSSFIFAILAVLEEPLVGIMVIGVGIFGILYSWIYIKDENTRNLDIDEFFHKIE